MNVGFFLLHKWIQQIELKNKGPKHTYLAMFYNFCIGIHIYSAFTYDVMETYLTCVSDEKIYNGYVTLKTRVVMW